MSQKIGPREAALRAMRDAAVRDSGLLSKREIKDKLTSFPTSGKKPVKRRKPRQA